MMSNAVCFMKKVWIQHLSSSQLLYEIDLYDKMLQLINFNEKHVVFYNILCNSYTVF
jgi:hypothetical protein